MRRNEFIRLLPFHNGLKSGTHKASRYHSQRKLEARIRSIAGRFKLDRNVI